MGSGVPWGISEVSTFGRAFCQFPNCQSLNISGSAMGSKGLETLAHLLEGNSTLVDLSIGSSCMADFVGSTELQNDITHGGEQMAGLRKLAEVLPSMRSLRCVDLGDSRLDVATKELLEAAGMDRVSFNHGIVQFNSDDFKKWREATTEMMRQSDDMTSCFYERFYAAYRSIPREVRDNLEQDVMTEFGLWDSLDLE